MTAATSWPEAGIVIALILGATIFLVAGMARNFARTPIAPAGTPRLKKIEDELVAVRADLAEIKSALAELDRQFKSVG
ncbi:MAG: hypothetical protein Q8K63_12680 [Acidimicrobiales bacterium]|nr:hypothetical protein [Acidimicrobiales bacterium]